MIQEWKGRRWEVSTRNVFISWWQRLQQHNPEPGSPDGDHWMGPGPAGIWTEVFWEIRSTWISFTLHPGLNECWTKATRVGLPSSGGVQILQKLPPSPSPSWARSSLLPPSSAHSQPWVSLLLASTADIRHWHRARGVCARSDCLRSVANLLYITFMTLFTGGKT